MTPCQSCLISRSPTEKACIQVQCADSASEPIALLLRTSQATDCPSEVRDDGDVGWKVAPLVVLALALSTVDSLLRKRVTDRLEQPALTDLACQRVVYAVLESVDLLDTGDLGLVEFAWKDTPADVSVLARLDGERRSGEKREVEVSPLVA